MARGLSIALGYDMNYLPDLCKGGETISLMRSFHYLPYSKGDAVAATMTGAVDDRIGSSPHTDWGFITMIVQDDSQVGLQYCDRFR